MFVSHLPRDDILCQMLRKMTMHLWIVTWVGRTWQESEDLRV